MIHLNGWRLIYELDNESIMTWEGGEEQLLRIRWLRLKPRWESLMALPSIIMCLFVVFIAVMYVLISWASKLLRQITWKRLRPSPTPLFACSLTLPEFRGWKELSARKNCCVSLRFEFFLVSSATRKPVNSFRLHIYELLKRPPRSFSFRRGGAEMSWTGRARETRTDEFLITLLVPHLVQHSENNFYGSALLILPSWIYISPVVAINHATNYKTFFFHRYQPPHSAALGRLPWASPCTPPTWASCSMAHTRKSGFAPSTWRAEKTLFQQWPQNFGRGHNWNDYSYEASRVCASGSGERVCVCECDESKNRSVVGWREKAWKMSYARWFNLLFSRDK